MSYHLKLQEFEGPLDLLLHLIKKEEAELDKISLSKITDQYLDYISGLAELDLDQASEFVLLAATLLQLKARSVLPRPAAVSEDFDEEPVEWPAGPGTEADLAERLNVYHQFKQLAERLQEREETWSKVYTRSAINEALAEGFSASIPAGSISLTTLCNAFQKILDNLETPEPYLELASDQVTIIEQMEYILERVGTAGAGKPVTFNALFSQMSTRGEIVVTFLALLELIRCQQVRVMQEKALGPILVERAAAGSLGAGMGGA